MRILLVSPYDLTHPGGVTSHVFDLAHQLQAMGHQPTVAGPAGDGLLPQNGYTHHLGSTVKLLSPGDAAMINLNPFVVADIRRFLAEHHFDVIHLHEPYLPFIGPAFLHFAEGVKIGTFHTWRQGPHLPYIVGWPLIKYWSRMLQGRVAVSNAALKTISTYVKADYHVIPNGVDCGRFARPAAPPEHYADERLTFLYVGRIEARKGIPFLLQAFQQVKARIADARLVLIGEGGLKEQYRQLAASMGLQDVCFEGFVSPEALPSYYQRADVFCSPSTVNESFGITLLEAMAARTPTVATTTNGATLGEDGVHGLLVPPRDATALAEAMLRLAEDRSGAERMAVLAEKRAQEFDWSNVALKLTELYQAAGA